LSELESSSARHRRAHHAHTIHTHARAHTHTHTHTHTHARRHAQAHARADAGPITNECCPLVLLQYKARRSRQYRHSPLPPQLPPDHPLVCHHGNRRFVKSPCEREIRTGRAPCKSLLSSPERTPTSDRSPIMRFFCSNQAAQAPSKAPSAVFLVGVKWRNFCR
jgi:hypothetical protein